MMETIGDYENWRDKQQDSPMPEPDEHSIGFILMTIRQIPRWNIHEWETVLS